MHATITAVTPVVGDVVALAVAAAATARKGRSRPACCHEAQLRCEEILVTLIDYVIIHSVSHVQSAVW